MLNKHGEFIWYELLTGNSDEALSFYSAILGWQATSSGQPDRDYRILRAQDQQTGESFDIGGLMQLTEEMRKGGVRPIWLGYIGVDNVDQTVKRIVAAGGNELMPAADIPQVGRIAMVADPQGIPFYVMRGSSSKGSMAFAADRPRPGHCAWNELLSSDPEAAKAFYFDEFGWSKDGEMDMGPMGRYEFIRHNGVIGAIMPKPEDAPTSMWQYYFRCEDIDLAVTTVTDRGGHILRGPDEIPGGDFSVNAVDPQGALFSLVGSRDSSPTTE